MPELEEQLRAWSADLADSVLPIDISAIAVRSAPTAHDQRRHRTLAAAIACVVLVAGVIALAALSGRGASSPAPATQPSLTPATQPPSTTDEPASTAVDSVPPTLVPEDALAVELAKVGVDLEAAPPSVRTLDGAVPCGSEVRTSVVAGFDETARRCFLDRHVSAQPAVFVEVHPTVEGDPLVRVWRTLDDGTVAVNLDSTRDRFGSGTWTSRTCGRLTTEAPSAEASLPPFVFECADPSDGAGPLSAPSADMPTWVADRAPLPLCGYEVRLSDHETPARACFADAAAAGERAEFVVVATGDEGERAANWFRLLGDGRGEVFEWQSGGDVGAPQTYAPSQWLHFVCPGGLSFADDFNRLPAYDVSCVLVESPAAGQGGVDGPVIYAAPSLLAEEALGSGIVELVDECLVLAFEEEPNDRFLIVWKFSTTWDESNSEVVLPDGNRVAPGDAVELGGGYHTIGRASSYVKSVEAESALAACAASTGITEVFIVQH